MIEVNEGVSTVTIPAKEYKKMVEKATVASVLLGQIERLIKKEEADAERFGLQSAHIKVEDLKALLNIEDNNVSDEH